MGFYNFLKNAGAAVLKTKENKADDIKKYVLENLEKQGNQLENLSVEFDDGAVTLSGDCDTVKTKEKAILIAGNIEGVGEVDGDGLSVKEAVKQPEAQAPATPPAAPESRAIVPEAPAETQSAQESQFYTIQSGDTLSKVAKQFYGDPNKYMHIFNENKGVIEDPDKIYPGQVIRIPPLK
jgi:nucleoid-associated protein YgaU